MSLALSPKARPIAHILALLPILAVIALIDMGLPGWSGVPDTTKLVGGWAQLHRLLSAAWWLVLGLFLFLSLEVVIWRALQAHKMAPPKLLVDLVRALVFVVAIFGALSAFFDQTLTGLLATSGVVAIVLGFALQSTLADLFSGIALNLERPFRVGDWLNLDSGIVGQVVQTNWRATHLRTLDGNDVVIPNSKMAAAQLTNFDQPARSLRQTITIPLPADISPARVQGVLIASAMRCERVLADPPPRALVGEFQDGKVVYRLDYWIESFRGEPDIRSEVSAEVWRALDVAGVSLIWLGDQAKTAPSPSRDKRIEEKRKAQILAHRALTLTQAAHGEVDRLLTRVDLFRQLDDEHRRAIADCMARADVARGQAVVEQGEKSDCLFIIGEGLLEVSVTAPNGERKVVNRLCSAQVFGEMALLTGEARSATVRAVLPSVVYAISKSDFLAILRDYPELAAALGEILQQRKRATAELLQTLTAQRAAAPAMPHDADLFERVKVFFGLQ
ncbi:MAG TPA: mechanosensitive ion channel family protein [Alphaproteobacteria bacterium]|nr:mechanosensitive ion channel family protein [Alphaproteobacteria bacterium]